jgi:hypothetical protein
MLLKRGMFFVGNLFSLFQNWRFFLLLLGVLFSRPSLSFNGFGRLAPS